MKVPFEQQRLLIRLNSCACCLLMLLVSCKKESTPVAPTAIFSTSSKMGFTGRVFTFDASESSDPDGDPLTLQCRWDFNSDGQWDTEYSTERIAHHVYSESGIAKIRLEVQDKDGLTGIDTDSVTLFEPVPDTVFTDLRDDQQYRAVKLGGKWWMAENLRYGTRIHSSEPQTDNGIVEYYTYDDDPSNLPVHGGLYNWNEPLMNQGPQNAMKIIEGYMSTKSI